MTRRPSRKPRRDGQLPARILPTAGTMVGVCTTLVGLVKLAEQRRGSSHVDEYAAATAVVFLVSAFTSYLSIRSDPEAPRAALYEAIADIFFVIGLAALTLITLLFAYELI